MGAGCPSFASIFFHFEAKRSEKDLFVFRFASLSETNQPIVSLHFASYFIISFQSEREGK
jgi:hypothetical protein